MEESPLATLLGRVMHIIFMLLLLIQKACGSLVFDRWASLKRPNPLLSTCVASMSRKEDSNPKLLPS